MPPKRNTPEARALEMCRAVLESQIGNPKVDFNLLARKMGYANARTAQDSYYRFRARLRGDKNYGDRQGRAGERFSAKLRALEGPSDFGQEWGKTEGEGSGGFGFFETGETMMVDLEAIEEEKENEIKPEQEQEEWHWEGDDVTWTPAEY